MDARNLEKVMRRTSSLAFFTSEEKGFSIIEVMIAGAICTVAMLIGIQSHRASSLHIQQSNAKEAIQPIEEEIKSIGKQVVTTFLKELKSFNQNQIDRGGQGLTLTQTSYDYIPFARANGYRTGSGLKFVVLDRSQMGTSPGGYSLPNHQPGNPAYQAAKQRCENASTVYDTNVPAITDVASKKSLYWCMSIGSASDSSPKLGRMNAMVEFLYTPINIRTGQQLQLSSYMASKDFTNTAPNQDEYIAMLYYSVYWSSDSLAAVTGGENRNMANFEHNGFFVLGR